MSLFQRPRDRCLTSTRKRKKSDPSSFITDAELSVNERFPCDLCKNEYDSETERHLHRYAKHKKKFKKLYADGFVCKICISKLESHEELVKHVKTEHLLSSEDADYVEREIFICDFCHRIFFNKQMLSYHLLFFHNLERSGRMKMQCLKCSRMIRVKQAGSHFRCHMIQTVTCCPICLTKCKSRRDLTAHIKEHPPYYHCTLCGFDSKIKHPFTMHMRAHIKSSNSFSDSLVSKCFIPRVVLRRSNYNFGLRGLQLCTLVVCILCRAICTEETAPDHVRHHLVGHLNTKRVYLCMCGETFFNTILLKHHVFRHKGEDHKPFFF